MHKFEGKKRKRRKKKKEEKKIAISGGTIVALNVSNMRTLAKGGREGRGESEGKGGREGLWRKIGERGGRL